MSRIDDDSNRGNGPGVQSTATVGPGLFDGSGAPQRSHQQAVAVAQVGPPWTWLPKELALHVLDFLLPPVLGKIASVSRQYEDLATDPQLWRRIWQWQQRWKRWSRYVDILPTIIPEDTFQGYRNAVRDNYQNHVRRYQGLSSVEREVIMAAIAGDKEKLAAFTAEALDPENPLKDQIRNRLLIIAAVDGDIDMLRALGCTLRDVDFLGLITRAMTFNSKAQAILDYFLERAYLEFRGDIWINDPNGNAWAKRTLAHWAAMLNQPELLKRILEPHHTPITIASIHADLQMPPLLRQ